MSGFSENNIEQIVEICRNSAHAISRAFSRFIGSNRQISVGSLSPYDPALIPDSFKAAGLVVLFQVADQGAAVIISNSLLPSDWEQPLDDSRQQALQILSSNWSMAMMPLDLEVTQTLGIVVDCVETEIAAASPAPWCQSLEFVVTSAGTESETVERTASDTGQIHMLWPLMNPPFPLTADTPDCARTPEERAADRRHAIQALSKVPLPVVVRLAEKKVDVAQVMDISPGLLITFNKPCDDLLDLYVNNHLYCRGEAVKIGEKFGLKVNDVDVEITRENPVVNG